MIRVHCESFVMGTLTRTWIVELLFMNLSLGTCGLWLGFVLHRKSCRLVGYKERNNLGLGWGCFHNQGMAGQP